MSIQNTELGLKLEPMTPRFGVSSHNHQTSDLF